MPFLRFFEILVTPYFQHFQDFAILSGTSKRIQKVVMLRIQKVAIPYTKSRYTVYKKSLYYEIDIVIFCIRFQSSIMIQSSFPAWI